MDEFDFVEHYDEAEEVAQSNQLPENEVETALNCAFIGVGGGGGKLAKAFLDLGFLREPLGGSSLDSIFWGILFEVGRYDDFSLS